MAATYSDLKIFHPELLKVMFLDVRPPERLYKTLFRPPMQMGMYSFSQGQFDDPFGILPPVEELEDAKSMFAEQEIEDYVLQSYRGFIDISNKAINQFKNAGNMKGLLTQLRERYMMVIREAYENTMEYTCFKAMDDQREVLSTSKDWTSAIGTVTADDVIANLINARKAYNEATRYRADTVVLNPEATAQILLRKDIANQLYTGNRNLDTGEIGDLLNMRFYEQPGGYTNFEGEELTMFAPATASKALAYVFNKGAIGYPVVFGSPEFNVTDNYDKDSVRIYVNGHMGFVYNQARVDAITV